MRKQRSEIMTKLRYALPALALLLAVSGCGGDPYGLSQVTGVVTMDGAPLPSAAVSFRPASGRPAQGITDQDGRYELIYIRDIRGAEQGAYTVSITTYREASPDPVAGKPKPETIPARYNKQSTLTAEVESGANEINFDLTSSRK